ncbi:MAG: hypothetical protein ACM3ZQ_09220 [Bacillota bacterium]
MIYLLVALNVILLVSGQILWKTGIPAGADMKSIILAMFTFKVMAGIALYGVATILWLFILSRGQFSVVYPLQSTAYALGVLVAWLVFKEAIPMTRWIGVGLIFAGAGMIALR